jgi:hypothetical protein
MTRSVLRSVLVVLGTLLAFLAILAIWVSRQALETDQWTKTSSELLESPAVQTAVAGYLVDQLYANVDVAGQVRSALPKRAQPLAGAAAGALRRGAEDVTRRALGRPRVQELWEAANRNAHRQLVNVIEGGGTTVSTQNGTVTLNLKTLLDDVAQRTGVGSRVAAKIPPSAAQIRIVRSNQLATVQKIGKALKPLAAVLVLLTLACFGGAIALGEGRRRRVLRAAGFALIFAGAAALVTQKLLGDQVVSDLSSTASVQPAVADVWRIGTSMLREVAQATIAYGVVVVIGAWLAGPMGLAVSLREWMAPYLRDWRIAYGVTAGVILLVLLWGPTEGTRRPVTALVLILLLAGGVEALRRQVAHEHPDAVRGEGGTTTARARELAGRARAAVAARTKIDSDLVPAGAGGAEAVTSLERLDELHRSGVLDDAEFAAAKNRVLNGTNDARSTS